MAKQLWGVIAGGLLAAGCILAVPSHGWADDTSMTLEERLEQAEETIRGLQEEVTDLRKEQDTAPVAAAAAPADDESFRVFWKDGLRFETRDKKFTTKIGGRVQFDTSWGDEDEAVRAKVGDFQNGVEFRRARLYIAGTMYDNIEYKAQYDFVGGDADFKDVYVGMTSLPYVGGVRLGQFKEPFSLEELTSSNYITFMERALPNALSPSRSTGAMLHNTFFDKRMKVALGVFRHGDSFGDSINDGEFVFSGRLAGQPLWQDKGRKMIHLGFSGRRQNIGGSTFDIDSRPENHIAPRYIDTGDIVASNQTAIGAEAAGVFGPFSAQFEWMQNSLDRKGGESVVNFPGFYVFASYFLTGEHRPYSQSKAAFDKVKPKHNFSIKDGGWGAWELGVRYSQLDLRDSDIKGGELRDTTVGLNWYLNPNTRVMFNYVHPHLKSIGNANLFGMRFQVFF